MAQSDLSSLPNNLGPTLLLFAGLATAPIGLGLVLMLIGLALLKDADGALSYPQIQASFKKRLNLQPQPEPAGSGAPAGTVH